VKPPPFDYVRAETLAEVHETLTAAGSDASVLAGGQTLLPLLSTRMARPSVLIDIMHIPQLAEIVSEDSAIRVGAAVRQSDLLAWPDLVNWQPLLALTLPWIGHAQTRSRGTVCGSVALADPSAELPLTLLALGGDVLLSSERGKRRVVAREFFTGLMSTVREDDELIEAVRFPIRRTGQGFAFREFGRRHGDFAIVACAAVASEMGVRLAVAGVADRPVARDFSPLEGEALDEALDAFAWDLDARDDLHATGRYRRELVRRFGRSAIEEAQQCIA
jgi:2-furoyl-CoA dehydrogenase FAD binding subunit